MSAPEKNGDCLIIDIGLDGIDMSFRKRITIILQAAGCAGTAAKGKVT